MAKDSQYLLEEPTTGLYVALRSDGAHLSPRKGATRFSTRNAAHLAANGQIADQPHEVVRLDA